MVILIFLTDSLWQLVLAALVLLIVPITWAAALTASRGYTGSYGALLVFLSSPIPFAAYGAIYLAHRWTLEPPPNRSLEPALDISSVR